MALKAGGSLEEASGAFQQTLKLSPGSLAPVLQLAELNLVLGNPTAAAQYASDVIRRQPLAGQAHLFLAAALVRLGNMPRAEPEVLGLLKGSPDSADVMVLAGDFYWAKSDLKKARQSYEHALTLEQGSIPALTGLTRIDLSEKKPQAARSRLEAQLAKKPDDENLLTLAGSAFMDLGEPQRSEATFRHLLEVNPASLQAYGALAGIYVSQHRLDDARQEYEEISRRNPTAAPAALTMVGTILSLQGQNDEARKRYQQALALDPTMPIAANNLAWDYAETGGNLDVALTLVQTAKSKLPNDGTVSDTLGWVYYKKGLASLAITSFEEAAKQSPSDPSIRYRLGLAYRKNGEQTKARGSFEQALKLNPRFKEAEDAKRELATLKG
jgi:tetratricopeptide (TPR) repeat protein